MSLILVSIFLAFGFTSAVPFSADSVDPAWPNVNQIPPTNSPIVQTWISQIDWSQVPNDIRPSNSAVCDASVNPENVARAAEICWWTCNGCTRATDVTVCPNTRDWGVTYDDGPSPSTLQLLDKLAQDATKATFFVVGSQVAQYPDVLRRTASEGHEIALHTWSHQGLTTLTNEEIVAELGWSREIVQQVLGRDVQLKFIRPPYGDIDDRVRAISLQMGLVPTIWTAGFDTNDWRLGLGPGQQPGLEAELDRMIGAGMTLNTGFITLQHDLTETTVRYAIDIVLPRARQAGYALKSLAQCGAFN